MSSSLQTPFNSAQLELLKLFSQGLTEEQLEELRDTLIEFRFRLLDEQVQKIAKQKGLDMDEINEASKGHRRKIKGNQPDKKDGY